MFLYRILLYDSQVTMLLYFRADFVIVNKNTDSCKYCTSTVISALLKKLLQNS